MRWLNDVRGVQGRTAWKTHNLYREHLPAHQR